MKLSTFKTRLLLGAAAMAAVGLGMAGAANAADIYGGGSSLVAPYARQAADCFGNPTPLVIKATPPTLQPIPFFNYTGSPAQDCSTAHVDTTKTIRYISTGSGTGINGVYSHDGSLFGDTDPNTAGNQFYPSVQYGLSDNSLDATDVGIYNNGGTGNHVGVTVVAPGQTPGPGQYANPREKYGPMIQFPLTIDAVAIAYDPVYKKVRNGDNSVTEYKFHISGGTANGGLKLDATTYCKIFNGQITNWNDPALKALNGNVSLRDPADPTPNYKWSVPMQIVGRFDSSGTTSIYTRHLAAACASLGGNAYADAATTLPAGLQGPHYDKSTANSPAPAGETLGLYTRADGNDGVAKYLDFTVDPGSNPGDSVIQGRIGYLGPDFALPAVLNTGANTYGLNTAKLKNASGVFTLPTPSAALLSFGALTPPDSLPNGHYDVGSSDPRSRANPQDWVEPPSKTSALANPTAKQGYPIVGTTNFIGYTCYKAAGVEYGLVSFLSWYELSKTIKDPTLGLMASSGFAALPQPWRTAINETLLYNGSGLGLNMNVKGAAGACSAAGVIGG